MFDALARLADRRHRLVLVVAAVFVLFAAAFGGPLVTLLDSDDDFEDHASESVLARDAVERASGRSGSPDLVVLVRLGGDVDSAASQAKIARVAGALRDPGVADVAAYRDGRPEALVSRDRRSTYVLATFGSDVDEDALAERLQERVEREPGVTAGGGQLAFTQVSEQMQEDLARAELLAFPLLFLLSLVVFRSVVAALLPVIVGATTILTTFVLHAAGERGRADVGVRHQPDHGRRARPRDRLLAVRRLALPRGARHRRGPRRCAAGDDAHGRPHGAVQRRHGRGRDGLADGLPPAVPVLDGRRRRARRADRRARVADRAAGAARCTRAARERAQPEALAGGDQPRRRARARGPVVPVLAARDAAPWPDRRRDRGAADRARPAVPAYRRSPASTRACCRATAPRAWSRTRSTPSSRPAARRRSTSWRGPATPAPCAPTPSALEGLPSVAAVQEPQQAGGVWRIDVVTERRALSEPAKQLVDDVRATDAPFAVQVGGGTAAIHRPAERRCGTRCRSRSRCSARRRS